MRMLGYPWSIQQILTGKPSIGWLVEQTEENFKLLMRLCPKVRSMVGVYQSRIENGMDLHLEILEQTPYTTLLHLTYYFNQEDLPEADPDATIRLYFDSRQLEVIDLKQHILPLKRDSHWPTLEEKWRTTLFISKWLTYCLGQGHRFSGEPGKVSQG